MTIKELLQWIRAAPEGIQNTSITELHWWGERTVLRHQFLVLRFTHSSVSYELRLERVGKLIWSPARAAVDEATFTVVEQTHDIDFQADHQLLFAFLTDSSTAPAGMYASLVVLTISQFH